MTHRFPTLAVAAALVGVLTAPAQAQLDAPAERSSTAGFNVGVFFNGSAAQVEDADEADAGGGASLHLGYGFGPAVSVFSRLHVASIQAEGFENDQYALAHFDLGVRYSFGSTAAALRPFVQGAYSGRAASFDVPAQGTLDVRGSGFTAGGGLEYFVTPRLAIEGGLSYSLGEFDEGRMGDSEWVDLQDASFSMNTTRLDLGISWHP